MSSARESVVVVDRSARGPLRRPRGGFARRRRARSARVESSRVRVRARGKLAPIGGGEERAESVSGVVCGIVGVVGGDGRRGGRDDVRGESAVERAGERARRLGGDGKLADVVESASGGFRLGASAGTRTRAAIAGGDARRISSWSDARCAAVRHGSHVATTAWHISSPHGSKPDHANAGSERRAAAASAAREPSTGGGEASPARREAPLEASSSSSRSATPRTSVRVSNTSPGARASLSATAAAR